jgi:hypothetical protein
VWLRAPLQQSLNELEVPAPSDDGAT